MRSTFPVTFVTADGREHTVHVEEGQNLMQAALDNRVPGIAGDCGGFCICATCHAYVDPAWRHVAGQRSDDEQAILMANAYLQENSRLTCQMLMSETLAGIRLNLPVSQY